MISIIAAMTKDRVLGKDNTLLWHISEDLKNFKRLTLGNTIIMGRKTFDSIGRALPNRNNIVVSRTLETAPEGVIVCKTVEEALRTAKGYNREIFIIGGGELYKQTLDLADRMYLSFVPGSYEGDTFFPDFDERKWKIVEEKTFPEFRFVVYDRIKTIE